jgi:hypothetical protein
MRFAALFALILSSAVHADTFSFSYSGWGTFEQTYYTCSAAEDILEDHLETLGAKNVRVSCSGGLENWGNQWRTFPLNLRATYINTSTGATTRNVRITSSSGRSNGCDFNTKLLNKLIPKLGNVQVTSKRDRCIGESSRWEYNLVVTE